MNERGVQSLDPILGPGGTQAFFDGGWPEPIQVQFIEDVLGWPYGTVEAIVARPAYSELTGMEHALVAMVHSLSVPERRALIELLKVTKARSAANSDHIDGVLHAIEGEETA